MADKIAILGEINRQMTEGHKILLDDEKDYLGLMPYVISPFFNKKMKEHSIHQFGIPHILQKVDYDSLEVKSSDDLGKLMPSVLALRLESLSKCTEQMLSSIEEEDYLLFKGLFYRKYLSGITSIKDAVYGIKDNSTGYIKYFALLIQRLIDLDNRFKDYDCITCVPSSDPSKNSGLESILQILNKNTEKECTPLLFRTRYKEPKHLKDSESDTNFKNNLKIQNSKKYKGIILFDDVITTGKTLDYCALLLSQISEKPIIKIALTETVNTSHQEANTKKYLYQKFKGRYRETQVKKYMRFHFLHCTAFFVYKALMINQHAFRKNQIRMIIDPVKDHFINLERYLLDSLLS